MDPTVSLIANITTIEGQCISQQTFLAVAASNGLCGDIWWPCVAGSKVGTELEWDVVVFQSQISVLRREQQLLILAPGNGEELASLWALTLTSSIIIKMCIMKGHIK